MRNVIVILTLSVLSVACAPKKEHVQVVDPAFVSYIAAFEADAKAHGLNIHVTSSIRFSDTLAKTQNDNGLCEYDDDQITIDRKFWDDASWGAVDEAGENIQRVTLIYHELGHCMLGRHEHVNTTAQFHYCSMMGTGWTQVDCPPRAWTAANKPLSIMHSTIDAYSMMRVPDLDQYMVDLKTELFAHAELPFGNLH